MIDESAKADPAIHSAAIRLARECCHIIQACLREEEWCVADAEFYKVIRSGLEEMEARSKQKK